MKIIVDWGKIVSDILRCIGSLIRITDELTGKTIYENENISYITFTNVINFTSKTSIPLEIYLILKPIKELLE